MYYRGKSMENCKDCGAEKIEMIFTSFCPNDCDNPKKIEDEFKTETYEHVVEYATPDLKKVFVTVKPRDPPRGPTTVRHTAIPARQVSPARMPANSKSKVSSILVDLCKAGKIGAIEVIKFETTNTVSPTTRKMVDDALAGKA